MHKKNPKKVLVFCSELRKKIGPVWLQELLDHTLELKLLLILMLKFLVTKKILNSLQEKKCSRKYSHMVYQL